VFRLVGRIATIIALCCAIGLHWIALQSFAWTTMILEYSKRGPIRQAIVQTFGGAHPCSICHAVSKGKSSEKKSDLRSPTQKIDMTYAPNRTRVPRPFVFFEYPSTSSASSEVSHRPPVPPPRSVLT
jgi:hypothetical protein